MFPSRRDKRQKLLIQNYRATFDRTPAGRATLSHLLGSYGLLNRIETDAQRERHNMGVELLEHLGVVQGANWDKLVEAMLELTIPDEAIEPESEQQTRAILIERGTDGRR